MLDFGDLESNVPALQASLDYLVRGKGDQVQLLVRKGRKIKRLRSDGTRFQDVPETGQGDKKNLAKGTKHGQPVLVLLRQNGTKEDGWNDCAFWWPVLRLPIEMKSLIFATQLAGDS